MIHTDEDTYFLPDTPAEHDTLRVVAYSVQPFVLTTTVSAYVICLIFHSAVTLETLSIANFRGEILKCSGLCHHRRGAIF